MHTLVASAELGFELIVVYYVIGMYITLLPFPQVY